MWIIHKIIHLYSNYLKMNLIIKNILYILHLTELTIEQYSYLIIQTELCGAL